MGSVMEETDFWSATQEAFAPLNLSSPQLQEKLLKKPPFRFIHDLITAVNERFQTFASVIPPQLSDSTKIDNKEQKIEFLNVIISHVEKKLGTKIDVNPKKIVSGNEAEKTNIFLQHVARAATAPASPLSLSPSRPGSPSGKKKSRSKSSKKGMAASTTAHGSPTTPAPSVLPSSGAPNGLAGDKIEADSLPHAVVGTKPSSEAVKQVLKEAKLFEGTIGRHSVDISGEFDVVANGKKIVEMWRSLNPSGEVISQSKIPEDALENALARQIEAARVMQRLNLENNKIIKKLEALLM